MIGRRGEPRAMIEEWRHCGRTATGRPPTCSANGCSRSGVRPCAKTPSRKVTEIIKLVTTMMLLALTTSAAAIECRTSKPVGAQEWWSYRIVDGRRCWYAGKPGMSKAQLQWARPASTAAVDLADAGPPPPPVVANPPPVIEPVPVMLLPRSKPIVVSVQTAPAAMAPPGPSVDIRRLFIAA